MGFSAVYVRLTPPHSLTWFLFSTAMSLLFAYWLGRALTSVVIARPNELLLRGALRSRSIPWSQVTGFEIGAWFSGPALFVRLSRGRKVLVPIIGRQRTDDLQRMSSELQSYMDQL
jgi:hypothetical protein